MGTASERTQEAMEQTRQYAGEMMEGARHNAIPIAMIGAGLAWLLVERLRGNARDRDYGAYRGYYREPYGPPYDESVEVRSGATPSETEPGYRTDWKERERARALSGRMHEKRSRLGETASHARERAMRATRRGRSRLEHMLNDNPLLVGAGALLLGAALGMALPETEKENEWLGETKENVMDRAQEMARGAASRAQDAVGEAAGEVASRIVSGKDNE